MYNVPGRTGSNMLADTTLRLAEHENIAAIKEASGNMDQITQVLMHKPDNFMVISGDDNLTLPLLMLGASGVISVAANVLPGKFSEMVRLGLKHDFESARKLHFEMFDFINLLFADGSPAGAKAALSSAGLCQNYLRLPLVPVNPVIKQRIVKKYNQLSQN
jgi:4-hydroxy-tetrahydrodipicolinate synthase